MGELAEHDGYGMAAYTCGFDRRQLEPAPAIPGVLQCPGCSHRSDEPGEGVLGDGFDVVHRQWGLRGDVHVWAALRELVATIPTPSDSEGVRAAYVDAFREVVDVDLDQTAESVVYRADLDRGGMSGGAVDLRWWRAKGMPLLVERAIDRRPVPQSSSAPLDTSGPPSAPTGRRTVRELVVGVVVWAIVLAIPAVPLIGGGYLLYQRAVGTRVEATVLDCSTSGAIVRGASTYRSECIASWTIDDRLVVGSFNGGNGVSDVGRTVDATVRGDAAYSRSLALPILLLALGLPFLALPVLALRGKRSARVE